MKFRVLVVDNTIDVLDVITEQLEPLGDDLVVRTADTVVEAQRLIATEFFDLAIVDLHMVETFESGIEVLHSLKETSPSCERMAMTRRGPQSLEVLSIVTPLRSLVDSIIIKQKAFAAQGYFAKVVEPRLAGFRATNSHVDGIEVVVEALLRSKRIWRTSRRDRDAVAAEVDSLIRRLFGGRFTALTGADGYEMRAELEAQGLSGAVAFSVIPKLSETQEGSRTFVKIGGRDDICDESARFKNVVQLNLPLTFRVELLGDAIGDYLGAVAYSFAGDRTGKVTPLDKIANEEGIGSPRITKALETLFNPDTKVWYGLQGPKRSLSVYFEEELGSRFVDRYQRLSSVCQNIATRYEAQFDSAKCLLFRDAAKLSVPSLALYGMGATARGVDTCLAHGDMHGGNVLLSDTDSLYLIDFAHAGWAPRAMDSAVLQGSIRLWDSSALVEVEKSGEDPQKARAEVFRRLSSLIAVEESLARNILDSTAKRSGRSQAWVPLCSLLDDRLRENFPDLSGNEILWSYLLQAARLSTLEVGYHGVLRLLAWYTGVARVLGVDDALKG